MATAVPCCLLCPEGKESRPPLRGLTRNQAKALVGGTLRVSVGPGANLYIGTPIGGPGANLYIGTPIGGPGANLYMKTPIGGPGV
ncbi:unnamed protein product [Boreogadus saida]